MSRRPGQRGRPSSSRKGGGRRSTPRNRPGLGGEQVEGRRAVRELLLAGRRTVREIVLAQDLDPAPLLDDIRQLATEQRVPLREVGRSKLDDLAVTSAPQGVVARAAPLPEVDLERLADGAGGVPFLLAVDGITDPQNLGAVLRTADGAGVTGVVLPRHRNARVTPAVTKAAAGAIEYLPIATVPGIPAALQALSGHGVWCVGLEADASTSVHDLRVATDPIVLVLGGEGRGLSRLVRERCDVLAAVPLRGSLDSLNVSVAAGVACYAIDRQRH